MFLYQDLLETKFLSYYLTGTNLIIYKDEIHKLKDSITGTDFSSYEGSKGISDEELYEKFFVKTNDDEIIEDIMKYYRKNLHELLEEINKDDNYYLVNVKRYYLLLLDRDDFYEKIKQIDKIINCNHI